MISASSASVMSVNVVLMCRYLHGHWNRFNIFKTFMKGQGMMMEFDEDYRDMPDVYCFDVSWISKFPDECEVLFARSLRGWGGLNHFSCSILDESNGVQTISLKKTYK